MKSASIRAVLEKARQLLSEGRWIQGNYTRRVKGRQCYCLVGAIYKAAGYDVLNDKCREPCQRNVARVAIGTIKVPGGLKGGYWLEKWNDSPQRTLTQVLRVLDNAIKRQPA